MEILKNKLGFICDMDGVIYHGNKLLPGVPEFVDWLYKENKNFLFLTNSSERSPKELQQKLKRMGLDVDESHFYTSALATARFISSQSPGCSVYTIGGAGLIMALHDEIDNVEKQLHDKLGCEAVIHMDPIVTNDEAVNVTHQRIAALVRGIDENISIHDFRMVTGPTHTNVIFDAVVPYGCKMSDREAEAKIKKAVHELDPSYFAVVQIDKSYVR